MSREIVLNRAFVVSLVSVIVALCALFGLPIDPATQNALTEVLVVVLPIVATFAAGLWARRDVTPTSDPRADDGTPLVLVNEIDAGDTEPVYTTGEVSCV